MHSVILMHQFFAVCNITQKKSIGSDPERKVVGELRVLEEMTFENVGFCNTVSTTTKYLTYADSEIGPLGIHYLRIYKILRNLL